MTATQTIRALHAANQLNQATIKTLEHRITELEEWVKAEGEHTDTCTFSILKRVCDGCRCERRIE